jgi:hypothetical protein
MPSGGVVLVLEIAKQLEFNVLHKGTACYKISAAITQLIYREHLARHSKRTQKWQ